ncbi:MAG TPA: ABC transporter permease subunit [Thermoanaerobaculia bacterium]|nr:ABC transporter permease subunit [Thermoanaerobaculia bacterium]
MTLNDQTGREPAGRKRTTSALVRVKDRAARALITLGGIGTIVAVSLVCVFLAWVVVPLFLPPSMPLARSLERAEPAAAGARAVRAGIDEYGTMTWAFFADGAIRSYRADSGEPLEELRPFGDEPPVATSFSITGGGAAFGFADGRVRLGRIAFETEFLEAGAEPAELRGLEVGALARFAGGVATRTPQQQLRVQRLRVTLEEPLGEPRGVPIHLLDQTVRSAGPLLASLTADGVLSISQVTQRRNLLTGEVMTALAGGELTLDLARGLPSWVLLSGLGDNVYLAWRDGRLERYDTRDLGRPVLAEVVYLTPEPSARLASLGFLIGKTSLAVGDDQGRVSTWFRVKPEGAQTVDGAVLVRSHRLAPGEAAVTSLAASERTRMLAAGFADGRVNLYHVTSGELLASGELAQEPPQAVESLTVAPKDDLLLALTGTRMGLWRIEAPHPETTFASLFRPIWYEGYEGPEHVWQSSSGTDDFEPKYGLYPLVFGTLKATFYSMLFGVPLALLAAVYTSEFMHPRMKARVKPTIELMAGLPSVVLGFLAALVIAPAVEDYVPHLLLSLAAVPVALAAGAYLWQLLGEAPRAALRPFKPAFVAAALPLGVALAWVAAPPFERLLFAGDVKTWLAGREGSAFGGWLILCLAPAALAVVWLMGNLVLPRLRTFAAGMPRERFARLEAARFLAGGFLVVAGAALLAAALTALGLDARGGIFDTYVQRNALVVGFIMGFAIIPIIYTISEDALSAVPDHLRAASLGAGATQWQTATRIIVPTAMSGLFSAVMIGLGRAVGETMIVLMAAGNTPVLEWNIFNGFRTLSANIAVELPEAAQGSTHFRTLFLAALVLFTMTFILNTVAEIVRMRFRRRAYQL